MPKVQTDQLLHSEVSAFIDEVGGVARAAKLLGLERSTLWRFRKSGCALERTRKTISEAMKMRNKNATSASIRDAHGTKAEDYVSLKQDDLVTMRAFCQKMLTLIDTYEALASRPA